MTEFDNRIEGEIKAREKETLRKIVIKKYGDKSLPDRIKYVKENFQRDGWTAEEMFAKLYELGLIGKDSLDDVKECVR